jgi:hypothetical protein
MKFFPVCESVTLDLLGWGGVKLTFWFRAIIIFFCRNLCFNSIAYMPLDIIVSFSSFSSKFYFNLTQHA